MGVSARIVIAFLMISAATAVPAGDARKAVLKNGEHLINTNVFFYQLGKRISR